MQHVSDQTVGSKQTHFFGARQSPVAGRQHSSRIGFSVAADINSNVFDTYFLVWSLSRLLSCVVLCCVVSILVPMLPRTKTQV